MHMDMHCVCNVVLVYYPTIWISYIKCLIVIVNVCSCICCYCYCLYNSLRALLEVTEFINLHIIFFGIENILHLLLKLSIRK